MSNIGKMTEWMRAQVGTRETGENNVRYNTAYYGREVSGSQYPWCAAFIWCGFQEAGLGELFLGGGKSAYCPYIVGWAKEHECWVTAEYREGDLLLYDWDGDGVADHIGYCLSWDGSVAVAVEGNAGDAVVETRRTAGSITGAYRIHYGEASDEKDSAGSVPAAGGYDVGAAAGDGGKVSFSGKALPLLAAGDRGTAVKLVQRRLLDEGYELPRYGADGDFGGETEKAVRAFQQDTAAQVDGIVGNETWVKLGEEKHGTVRL